MKHAKPLPKSLAQRYRGWRATDFEASKGWYERLVKHGQRPRTMVVSCCDSRVHVTSIFGAEMGEFFIHRNIANLIPPYKPDGNLHGTSAAIEYAVQSLDVSNILVLGHSHCGGVEGCLDMCSGDAPALNEDSSFVGRWMDLLREGYERVKDLPDRDTQLRALEKQAVLTSLENLMTFPYVAEAVTSDRLALHGLWTELESGGLEYYDARSATFMPV